MYVFIAPPLALGVGAVGAFGAVEGFMPLILSIYFCKPKSDNLGKSATPALSFMAFTSALLNILFTFNDSTSSATDQYLAWR